MIPTAVRMITIAIINAIEGSTQNNENEPIDKWPIETEIKTTTEVRTSVLKFLPLATNEGDLMRFPILILSQTRNPFKRILAEAIITLYNSNPVIAGFLNLLIAWYPIKKEEATNIIAIIIEKVIFIIESSRFPLL